MTTKRRTPIVSLLALAAIAALAGCGGSSSSSNGLESKSPAQILAAAKAAAGKAASVHVSGSIINEKKPISLDMELVAGKGAKGHLALEGLGFDIIEVEHAFYLKGSNAFYTKVAGAPAAQLLQGKWLKVPTTSGEFASLAQLTNLSRLIDATLGNHGTLAKGPSGSVGGQQAVSITDTTKGGTLYVASTGTAYPLEISKSGADAGKVVFNRWNQPVTLAAPPGAINIDQLQSGH
jgi:hypothetical protein